MKRRVFLHSAALATAGSIGLAAPAIASGKRRLKMVTTWPKRFPGLGTRAEEYAKDIEIATDGAIKIKVYAAQELVPAFGAFDAVSAGKADLYHGPDYYWQGKHKAFSFFCAVPFGLNAMELLQWMEYGGGQALWDEMGARFNVKGLLCCNTGMQMGGWYKKEINSTDDFKGLRIRMPGIGGEVLKRIGATPVTKAGGEIFLALSQGNIDASEWVGPWNDLAFGFYKVAPYYYTSGFHEPGPGIAAGFNLDVWNSLSKPHQAIIKAVSADHYGRSLVEFNARNASSLRTLVDKHNVKLRTFSEDIMQKLADISADVVKEIGQGDDISKRIYNSYMDTWRAALEWGAVADEPYFKARRASEKYGQKI